MTTAAIIGAGTIVSVETAPSSGVYTPLAEITSVTPPNESVDQVDVTNMDSPNRTKEFLQGYIDPGDVQFKLNHVPQSATDQFIIAWRASGLTRSIKITYPNTHTDTFPGFVKGYAPDAFNPGGAIQATLTCKVAGAIVHA
jgi:hypothetical protein